MINEALRIEDLHFGYADGESSTIDNRKNILQCLGLVRFMPSDTSEEILSGLNLTLQRGETLCIAGASGKGKSVLLRIIAGLEQPTKGQFYYFGEHIPNSLHSPLEIAKRGVGFVFQNSALVSNLCVRDNVSVPLYYHRLGSREEIEDRVNMALDLMRVHAEEKKFPHMLSSGMQKRVAIARSWAMDPKLLLMDDPMAGLDNYNRRTLVPLIDNMRAMFKTSIILVTHDLQIARELDCNLCFLEGKKLSQARRFEEWLESEEPFAKEMFRNLHEF